MNNDPSSQNNPEPPSETNGENPAGEEAPQEGWPSVEEISGRLDRLWAADSDSDSSGGLNPALADFHDLASKSIGPYHLERLLGRGAFGVVYLAKDKHLDREVALKLARPEVLLDEERLRRFRSEASTAAMLDHPLIVPVYGAEFNGPTPYIVSAYCPGPDLGQWLDDHPKPIAGENAARFLIRLSEAVEYAHQRGVMHRDLKPGNVLLEAISADASISTGEKTLDHFNPRLTDFGLARLIQESVNDTRSSLLVGTPLYMAPEQLLDDSKQESAATDVYAIGILLFELLTRQTPRENLGYVEGLDKLRDEDAPSVQTLRPDVPDALAIIIAKCLEREPEQRYASASALAAELQRFVDGIPIQTKPVDLKERFARWTSLPKRLTTAGYFTVLLQGMTISWLFLALFMMAGFELFPDGSMQRYANEVFRITLIGHLPTAWLGWRLARMRRWSYWPALAGSLFQLAVYLYSTVNKSVAFEYIHPTQLSKFNTFSILITCAFIQLILHLLAFPAWLKLRRKKLAVNLNQLPVSQIT